MDLNMSLVLVFINFVASSQGTVTVTDPSGKNAVTIQGTLSLRCTVSPLQQVMFWHAPAANGGSVCYCLNTEDECIKVFQDSRFTCTSKVSSNQFTLTVTNVNLSDEGSYRCRHAVSVTEDGTLDISVQEPITSVDVVSPTSPTVTVSENTPSTFVCETSAGRPQATIQWYKQLGTNTAEPVPGGSVNTIASGTSVITRSLLLYKPTRSDHDFRVFCTAYNIDVSSTYTSTNKPQLYVQYHPTSPTFTVQSQPVTSTVSVIEGSGVSVTCNSTSNPLPVYSWNPRGSSSNSDILTLTSVSTSNNGVYTCTVTNTMKPTQGSQESGSNSASITLNVLFPPRTPVLRYNTTDGPILISAFNVVRGDSFSIYCNAEGNPVPSYQWTSQSTNNNKLTVTDIQTDTSLTCTATNAMMPTGATTQKRSSTAAVTANVLYSASITEFTINGAQGIGPLIYNENTTLTVVCVVDSNPGSDITINRDGSIKRTAANTNELTHTVNEASCLDAGIYACTAGNKYNNNAFHTILRQMFIRCSPRPLYSVNNYTYYYALNERVTLNITVTAYPQPTFRWYKQDKEITIGVSKNDKQTNLTLERLTQDDIEQYKVVVIKNQGTLEHLFFVVAKGPPDMPAGFMLIRELQVPTFVWKKEHNGGYNQTFIIEVSRVGTGEWTQSLAISERANRLYDEIYIADISGLNPGSYLARILSKNKLGTSNASELVSPFLVLQTSTCSQDSAEQSPYAGVAAGVIAGIAAIAITALIIYIIMHRQVQRKDDGEENQSAKGETKIELREARSGESPYLNIGSDAALNEQHEDETRNAYERLDPAMKKDGLYEAMETSDASHEQHADTTRNVYEKLDPALKMDGFYEAMQTRKDEWVQDKGEKYVNLKV